MTNSNVCPRCDGYGYLVSPSRIKRPCPKCQLPNEPDKSKPAMHIEYTWSIAVKSNSEPTIEAIYKARRLFHYESPINPEQIEVSPAGKRVIQASTDRQTMPYNAELDTVMGMKIVVNPTFADDEFRVITSETTLKAPGGSI